MATPGHEVGEWGAHGVCSSSSHAPRPQPNGEPWAPDLARPGTPAALQSGGRGRAKPEAPIRRGKV